MAEKDCKDCAYCNMREFNRGRWYCNSPEVSVFNLPVPIDKPCFKLRKAGDGKCYAGSHFKFAGVEKGV